MSVATEQPQKPAHRVKTPALRYRKRYLRCTVPAADRERLTAAIEQLPAAMSGQMHNLDIKALQGTRHRGLCRLRVGKYRVIFWPVGREIVVLELDRRDDTTYAHLDQLVVMRRGDGVAVTDVPPTPEPPADVGTMRLRGDRTASRLAAEPERHNPLTVFARSELAAVGLDPAAIDMVRTLAPSIDIGETLAALGQAPEIVELVADLWYDPERYVQIFASGATPTPADAHIEADELATRLRSADSADAVAELSGRDFELVLRGSIEEWMFYLHPSQARIVRHVSNGPSRVKGGPGTGKTVAALHRARPSRARGARRARPAHDLRVGAARGLADAA